MAQGAGADGAPARPPSIRDVARLAGVSHQTVSRVLNEHPSIRPATLDRVQQAMATLGYRPNPAARALVTRRSGSIGVLSSQNAHFGPSSTIQAIEVAAREAGYTVNTTSVDGAEPQSIREGVSHLLDLAIEGLVIIAPQPRTLGVLDALRLTIPYVTMQTAEEDSDHSLSVDQVAGAVLATRHLIDLGHSRIFHLAGPQDWFESQARMRGFLDALTEAGLPTTAPIVGDWTAEFGYRAGLELARRRDFTAVFSSNDQMALGLIHAFHESSLSVPGDVSVVGFDDLPEAAHFWPPLTTVRQDFAEVGRRTMARLLGSMTLSTADPVSASPTIAPELVVRASTGQVGASDAD